MTIYNKEWVRTTIIRLYLSGLPQEEIATETKTSEGTVNSVIQEAILADNTLKLQREVAITAKRTGVSVHQLASNLACENSIKRLAFDKGVIDSVLKAIHNKFTQDGRLDPDLVAKIVLQIADMAMKNNLALEQLAPSIQRNYDELNTSDQEIKNKKKTIRELQKAEIHALDKNNKTRRELSRSARLCKSFEKVGLDIEKEDEITNFLSNVKEKNSELPDIIDELKEIRGLKKQRQKLEQDCRTLQNLALTTKENLEVQKNNLAYVGLETDIAINLLQRGIPPHIINGVFSIIQKHPPLLIESLSSDIDTYCAIQGAIFAKRTEFNFLVDFVANLEAQRNALLHNSSDGYANATRHNSQGDLSI